MTRQKCGLNGEPSVCMSTNNWTNGAVPFMKSEYLECFPRKKLKDSWLFNFDLNVNFQMWDIHWVSGQVVLAMKICFWKMQSAFLNYFFNYAIITVSLGVYQCHSIKAGNFKIVENISIHIIFDVAFEVRSFFAHKFFHYTNDLRHDTFLYTSYLWGNNGIDFEFFQN